MEKEWKMKRFCNIVLAVSMAVCVLAGCGNAVKEGAQLLEEGKVEEAAAAFEQVLDDKKSSDAQIIEAYRGLGMCYYEQEQYEQAQEYLQKAIDAGGKKTVVLCNLLGVCAMQQEDYAFAVSQFEEGLALAETDDGAETEDEMLREMRYNCVVCYEKLAEWADAYLEAQEYLEKYPDDEQMQHEAEFLETR